MRELHHRIQVRRAADDRSVTSRLSKTAALSKSRAAKVFAPRFARVSPCVRFAEQKRVCSRQSVLQRLGRLSRFAEPCQNLRCMKQRKAPKKSLSALVENAYAHLPIRSSRMTGSVRLENFPRSPLNRKNRHCPELIHFP